MVRPQRCSYHAGMRMAVPFMALTVGVFLMLALGLLALAVVLPDAVSAGARAVQGESASVVTGVIASIDTDNKLLIVKTRFGSAKAVPVSNADLLKDLAQGDSITAELNGDGVAERITKTAGGDRR